ncbi:MAG TPA: hypothetical protein VIU83_04555, partial [Candidatus Deferrimicrobium sp.]
MARRAVHLHGCALPHFAPPPAATPPDPPVAFAFRSAFPNHYRIYKTQHEVEGAPPVTARTVFQGAFLGLVTL